MTTQKDQDHSISGCDICLSNYHSQLDVRVLSCGHSFCFDCLVQLHHQQTYECPTCRTIIHELPTNLKKNFALLQLLPALLTGGRTNDSAPPVVSQNSPPILFASQEDHHETSLPSPDQEKECVPTGSDEDSGRLCSTKDCSFYGSKMFQGCCSQCFSVSNPSPPENVIPKIVLSNRETPLARKFIRDVGGMTDEVYAAHVTSLLQRVLTFATATFLYDYCETQKLFLLAHDANRLLEKVAHRGFEWEHAVACRCPDSWNIDERFGIAFCYHGFSWTSMRPKTVEEMMIFHGSGLKERFRFSKHNFGK